MPKSHHSSQSQAGLSTNRSAETAATSKSSPSKSDASTVLTAKERLDLYKQNTSRSTDEDEEELALKRKLIPRLAQRAYHLEDDNSWWQDWRQYQRNTHPVFGICMHHRFHPIRLPQRIIILVGSIGESDTTLAIIIVSCEMDAIDDERLNFAFHNFLQHLVLQ